MSTSEKIREEYTHLTESLQKQRDELKVQVNLARKDAHDEWDDIEKKWQHLESKLEQMKKELGRSGHDVGDAIKLLGEEIKSGYQRLRKIF